MSHDVHFTVASLWKRSFFVSIAAFMGILVAPESALGYKLIERAPCSFIFFCDKFVSVKVEWSDASGATIRRSFKGGAEPFDRIDFDTEKIEDQPPGLTRGTIVDWKQTRVLESGKTSTLAGKFASRRSPLRILSYQTAYAELGLQSDDRFFLPDFAADLDGDGFAETPLFSAINLFTDGSRFLNHEDFSFGVPYSVADFPELVFSLTDSIVFDPLALVGSGFTTANPAPANLRIVADAEHITGLSIPEPPAGLLLLGGVGALVLIRKQGYRMKEFFH